jgi:catechol 2,3-dioxygenase
MDTLPLDQADLLETAHGDDRLPAGTDMGHVHLEVTNLERSVEFYRDRLGLNLRDDGWDGAAFLAAGEYHHHVGLNTWNARREPIGDARGLISFELVLPDNPSLSALASQLEDEGHRVDRDEGPAISDPDGIEIRLRGN